MAEDNSVSPTELFQSSDLADVYARYRPTYGAEVTEAIITFCKDIAPEDDPSDASFSLAVDIGCGSGQSTIPLADHFRKVIGLDISEAQISRAPKHVPNLSFRVGPAEDLSFLEDGSVGLVTVGTALHWFNLERFNPEVTRVLRPGGALVAYTYGLAYPDDPLAQKLVLWYKNDLLGPYWASGLKHLESEYYTLSLPFPGSHRKDGLKTEKTWSVDEFVGFLCSWSAYHRYMLQNPESRIKERIAEKLKTIYQNGQGGVRHVTVMWPIFMLMGRKPM